MPRRDREDVEEELKNKDKKQVPSPRNQAALLAAASAAKASSSQKKKKQKKSSRDDSDDDDDIVDTIDSKSNKNNSNPLLKVVFIRKVLDFVSPSGILSTLTPQEMKGAKDPKTKMPWKKVEAIKNLINIPRCLELRTTSSSFADTIDNYFFLPSNIICDFCEFLDNFVWKHLKSKKIKKTDDDSDDDDSDGDSDDDDDSDGDSDIEGNDKIISIARNVYLWVGRLIILQQQEYNNDVIETWARHLSSSISAEEMTFSTVSAAASTSSNNNKKKTKKDGAGNRRRFLKIFGNEEMRQTLVEISEVASSSSAMKEIIRVIGILTCDDTVNQKLFATEEVINCFISLQQKFPENVDDVVDDEDDDGSESESDIDSGSGSDADSEITGESESDAEGTDNSSNSDDEEGGETDDDDDGSSEATADDSASDSEDDNNNNNNNNNKSNNKSGSKENVVSRVSLCSEWCVALSQILLVVEPSSTKKNSSHNNLITKELCNAIISASVDCGKDSSSSSLSSWLKLVYTFITHDMKLFVSCVSVETIRRKLLRNLKTSSGHNKNNRIDGEQIFFFTKILNMLAKSKFLNKTQQEELVVFSGMRKAISVIGKQIDTAMLGTEAIFSFLELVKTLQEVDKKYFFDTTSSKLHKRVNFINWNLKRPSIVEAMKTEYFDPEHVEKSWSSSSYSSGLFDNFGVKLFDKKKKEKINKDYFLKCKKAMKAIEDKLDDPFCSFGDDDDDE